MSQFFTRTSEKFPPGVKYIIATCVVVWLAQIYFKTFYSTSVELGGISISTSKTLTDWLALWPIGNNNFHFWQIITHMFAHADSGQYLFFHILFNMFTLWMFGRILENIWGTKRFLIFYMLSGLGAAVLHLAVQYFVYGSGGGEAAVGASGAVFGVLVAFAMLFPNTELYLMFIPVPIKAKWVVMGLIALDLFGGFSSSSDGVAHFAHLGGAITGFVLLKIWNKTNRRTLY